METTISPIKGFSSTGLKPEILAAISRNQFTTPTPIQEKAIPVALTGADIIGIAQTGTGKTMAFGLPILSRLLDHREEQALIVVPTRELALQVEEHIKQISRSLNPVIRSISLIGGMPIYRQIRDLKTNPRIIVATPGRLRDHLEQGTVKLTAVRLLVLDEADRMLDMGFAPQIKFICERLPHERQTMLFSATFAPEIARLAATFQTNPVRIEAAPAGTGASKIKHELCYVNQGDKSALLRDVLTANPGPVLVFSRTKHGAKKLARMVSDFGHQAAEIHSNRSLSQRRQALDGFKSGRYRVLVATDIASRGIDVHDIHLVINYDLPDASEDYIHRTGRTGRAGRSGLAISFATPEQRQDVVAIERLVGQSLPLSEKSLPLPTYTQSTSRAPQSHRRQPSRSNSFRRRGYFR